MDTMIGSFDWELKYIERFEQEQIELGHFQRKVIASKISNKKTCKEHKLYIEGMFTVTPQEELFSKLFNHEKQLVADMDVLQLRAHREELAKIAFEARARLTAVDDEEKTRKNKTKKPTGFQRSVASDDVSSDAINAINARKGKLTKLEKTIEGLVKMGMSRADAEKMCSAGVVLGQMRKQGDSKPAETIKNPFENTPLLNEQIKVQDAIEVAEIKANEEINKVAKPLVNPFAK